MKKLLLPFAIALLAQQTISAETFRVNNNPGSGAQYTTFAAAQEAASDGDVIIVDGSETSYGKIVVTKKITLKGPGYFLDQDESMNEAANPAKFEEIKVQAEGATLTGLYITDNIYLQNNNIVVTRCNVSFIYHSEPYTYSDKAISNCIIHQNFIKYGITGDSYSKGATYFQITNNIIASGNNVALYKLSNATISHNTLVPRYGAEASNLKDCVIEHNIIPTTTNNSGKYNEGNTFSNNYFIDYSSNSPYKNLRYYCTDREVKAIDETLTTTQGAFSGDDPYVLSGLPSGPMIQDVIMPESVAKGENLKVTVKIGSSK